MDTAKRLSGPALVSNSAADKYTVPAGTSTVVKSIIVNNTTGSAATLTLSIGADAAGTEIMTAMVFNANAQVVIPCWIPLASGEKIQGLSGTNNALNLTLCGVETV